MGNKTPEQRNIFETFYNSREEVINFFRGYAKMTFDAGYKAKPDETKQEEREQRAAGLKILTPKQMLQRLPIALAQVKQEINHQKAY